LEFHSRFINKLKGEVGKPLDVLPTKKDHKYKFIDHYHKKYSYPELPPSWMIFETLSFGEVSFVFRSLYDKHKKQIANHFGRHDKILSSWIHSICFLRNLCAHHSRVWNREMSVPPKLAKLYNSIQTAGRNKYFYGFVVIIKILLNKIDPNNNWIAFLDSLFRKFPNIRVQQMGFPTHWKEALDSHITH
jgi:abortive infection bacteriophage resistance protein